MSIFNEKRVKKKKNTLFNMLKLNRFFFFFLIIRFYSIIAEHTICNRALISTFVQNKISIIDNQLKAFESNIKGLNNFNSYKI